MPEELTCPGCGNDIEVPTGLTILKCKHCGAKLELLESGTSRGLALLKEQPKVPPPAHTEAQVAPPREKKRTPTDAQALPKDETRPPAPPAPPVPAPAPTSLGEPEAARRRSPPTAIREPRMPEPPPEPEMTSLQRWQGQLEELEARDSHWSGAIMKVGGLTVALVIAGFGAIVLAHLDIIPNNFAPVVMALMLLGVLVGLFRVFFYWRERETIRESLKDWRNRKPQQQNP